MSIQEVADIIAALSTPNLTDWIIVAITFIYTVATIFILFANKRSVDISTSQIFEQKKMQKMSIDLQLFDKRMETSKNLQRLISIQIGLIHKSILSLSSDFHRLKISDNIMTDYRDSLEKAQVLFDNSYISVIKTIDSMLNSCIESLDNLGREYSSAIFLNSTDHEYENIENIKKYFSDYFEDLIDEQSLNNYLNKCNGNDLFTSFIESSRLVNTLKEYHSNNNLINKFLETNLSFIKE